MLFLSSSLVALSKIIRNQNRTFVTVDDAYGRQMGVTMDCNGALDTLAFWMKEEAADNGKIYALVIFIIDLAMLSKNY